jgi:hypothetical protein
VVNYSIDCNFLESFMKTPILPEQEVKIIVAICNGTLSISGAKKVAYNVMRKNIDGVNKMLEISEKELQILVDKGA